MADKTLVCKDCGREFIFTEGEQAFYKEKGFDNEPQRCETCRRENKNKRRGSQGSSSGRFGGSGGSGRFGGSGKFGGSGGSGRFGG